MSLITQILYTCSEIHDDRTKSDILLAIGEEFGELCTEVAIEKGFKKRDASLDGVIGEALDLIISAVDMIHHSLPKSDPQAIEHALRQYATMKLNKWKDKE